MPSMKEICSFNVNFQAFAQNIFYSFLKFWAIFFRNHPNLGIRNEIWEVLPLDSKTTGSYGKNELCTTLIPSRLIKSAYFGLFLLD